MEKKEIFVRLMEIGVENPMYEAKIIKEDVSSDNIDHVLKQRATGMPLWRVLGYRDFWKNRFYLSDDTLEPRPDTETLIETVLKYGSPPKRILDLGIGTGCIILSLLDEYKNATGVGVDVADGALKTARENAARIGVENRVEFIKSNWLDSVTGEFDLIVSNPPYIPADVIPNLHENVKNFDPILALDGGDDGLNPYKKMLPNLKKHLVKGGRVLFEIGLGQVDDIARLVITNDANLIRVVRDLNGVERVVEIAFGDN